MANSTSGTFDCEEQLRSIVMDRENGVPLHVQLRHSLRRIIHDAPENAGKLTPENVMVKLLGVSQATVRKALDGLVEEGLIERRRALGTVIKHTSAKAQLAQVALIVPNYESVPVNAHMTALTRQTASQGMKFSLITLDRGENWHSAKQQLSFGPSEGGVILLGNQVSTSVDLYNLLHSQGYPTVHIGTPLPDCSCNNVSISNSSGIRMGLQRLLEAGHRRILFLVGEPEESRSVKERVHYFEEISKELGLNEAQVLHCGIHEWENSAEASTHAMHSVWKQRKRPTAIFGVSDSCSVGALFGLNQLGVRVPDEVSIMSYGGTEITRMVSPKLSTVVFPIERFPGTIFNLLSSRQQDRHVFIEPEYREGSSIRNIQDKRS